MVNFSFVPLSSPLFIVFIVIKQLITGINAKTEDRNYSVQDIEAVAFRPYTPSLCTGMFETLALNFIYHFVLKRYPSNQIEPNQTFD